MHGASGRGGSRNYDRLRLLVQAGAFALLVATPVLNAHFHISFLQGWFQSFSIGHLWFVSPLEGIESILTSRTIYIPLLVGMVPTLLVALLLGRVFCGWICPIHFFSDLSDRTIRLFKGRRILRDRLLLPGSLLWASLVGELLLAMILGAPIFVFLSPPGLVGRELMMLVIFHTLVLEGVVVAVVLAMNLVTRRMFCRYFCPLGALLALIGSRRRLTVSLDREGCTGCGRCGRICPLGLDPATGGGEDPRCWNCGACVAGCAQGALRFRWSSRR